MRDSRQNHAANLGGTSLDYRIPVLACQNHRNTSCDRRSHEQQIRLGCLLDIRLPAEAT
jgi:hypothetical protein